MWDAEVVQTRSLAIGSVVSLLVAGWLSLLGFDDRDVPCGPPLFGADPPANYSITPGTCRDMASDRLLFAAGFLVVGVALAGGAVSAWRGWRVVAFTRSCGRFVRLVRHWR